MKYQNSALVLPAALVETLQQYVQGEYLYIPLPQERRKPWGSLSGYRREMENRNAEIRRQYSAGTSVASLAEQYHLATCTIKKIIYPLPKQG